MKRVAIAAALALLLGCVRTTPPPREVSAANYRLRPAFDPGATVQVFVEDDRPHLETEREPSTDFVYSGALFAAEGNAKTVADGISQIIVKFGGAPNARISGIDPASGPAIVFKLEHWYSRYSRAPRKSDKSVVLVEGQFSGTVILKRDGKPVATRQITAVGTPSAVDMYVVFDREKRQTAGLFAKAMERTANSAEQNGYREIAKFLQEAWPSFRQSQPASAR